jgi:uncharacterized protein (TIGR03000 family)
MYSMVLAAMLTVGGEAPNSDWGCCGCGEYYTPVASPPGATVEVHLPADAALYVDGDPVPLTSSTRVFTTPSLVPGQVYSYRLDAVWLRGGQVVKKSQTVQLYGGRVTRVQFDERQQSEEQPTGVVLKWKFPANQKPFYQEVKSATDQTLKLSGNEMKQHQDQTFVYSWRLMEEKPNGDRVFEQKIEALRMKVNIAGQRFEFDSSKETGADDPLAAFKILVGAKFTVTFDKNFRVKQIKGNDELARKLGDRASQMGQLLSSILSDDAMKELIEPVFQALPREPVEKGMEWKRTSSLDLGSIGGFEFVYTYTYAGEENKKHNIMISGDVKYIKPGKAGSGEGGLRFKTKDAKIDSSKVTGDIIFDSESGWVESMTTDVRTKCELTIEIGNQTSKVDLEQKRKTEIRTLKDNPVTKP